MVGYTPVTGVQEVPIEPPIRILAVLSAAGVDAREEWRALHSALMKERKGPDIDWQLQVLVCQDELLKEVQGLGDRRIQVEYVDKAQLEDAFGYFKPNIVHFFCHGSLTPSPHLELATRADYAVGKQVGSIRLDDAELALLTASDGGMDHCWLITLNCCMGAAPSTESGTEHANSLAFSLVRKGFPAVIGMREPITSEDAKVHCGSLYCAVLDEIARCMVSGRRSTVVHWANALIRPRQDLVAHHQGEETRLRAAANSKEWTLPVLYVRSGEFRLRGRATNPGLNKYQRQSLQAQITILQQARQVLIPADYSRDATAGAREVSEQQDEILRRLDEKIEELYEALYPEGTVRSVATAVDDYPTVMHQAMPTPPWPLVANQALFDGLVLALEMVQSGEGRCIHLVGRPGYGKSHIIREVAREAKNRGFTVISGRSDEPAQAQAYAPFRVPLMIANQAAPDYLRSRVQHDWPELARLLRVTPVYDVMIERESGDAQSRLINQVAAFLDELCKLSPVTILLDDLHWADAASLALWKSLARDLASRRLLLLGAFRVEATTKSGPVETILGSLEREDIATRLELEPFSFDETERLIQVILKSGAVTPQFVGMLHALTAGNPLFVREIVRALQSRKELEYTNGHWVCRRALKDIDLPSTIQRAILERIEPLSPTCRMLLQQASVLAWEGRFIFDDLLQMNRNADGDITTAFQELLEVGLIEGVRNDSGMPGAQKYQFDHPLTGREIFDQLQRKKPFDFRAEHAAAGEAIESLPARKREERVAELAWHFIEAGDWKRAQRYAMKAGKEQEAIPACEKAEGYYNAALAAAKELGLSRKVAEARAALDRVEAIRGQSIDGQARVDPSLSDVSPW
jgi:hypothetical protein